MDYQTIKVEKNTPAIGATISKVDLSAPLSNQQFDEIHDALLRHSVIFFHDQNLTPDQQKDFSRRFGPLQSHAYIPHLEGHEEIVVLENDEKRPPNINAWHTDVTFQKNTPMGCVLYAREMPQTGGDTIWASMYAAYEALSDKMQSFLSGLTALHSSGHVFGRGGGYSQSRGADQAAENMPEAVHPVLRTHPETGRIGLFVNSIFTVKINDMKTAESDALLQFLFEHMTTPEFQVRFRWAQNSIAFWDNRCTQHYALADYWPERRLMHRVSIDGDAPFFKPEKSALN